MLSIASPYYSPLREVPDSSWIKVFGSAAYTHNIEATRKPKPDHTTEAVVYFGTYNRLCKIHLLRRKIIVTIKHAIFHEERFSLDKTDRTRPSL